jgi:hypothetical protein
MSCVLVKAKLKSLLKKKQMKHINIKSLFTNKQVKHININCSFRKSMILILELEQQNSYKNMNYTIISENDCVCKNHH